VHRVELLTSAARAFAKLDARARRRIARRIDSLAADPRPSGAQKLRGADDIWRVRVGDYRILYSIHDLLLVLVIKIGHRRDVYR
jgi:mRNA interferase RelE/StbE